MHCPCPYKHKIQMCNTNSNTVGTKQQTQYHTYMCVLYAQRNSPQWLWCKLQAPNCIGHGDAAGAVASVGITWWW